MEVFLMNKFKNVKLLTNQEGVSEFLECAGFDNLAINLIQEAGVNASVSVEFTHNKVDVHEESDIVATGATVGITETKAPYFRLKVKNAEVAEQAFTAYVHLKAQLNIIFQK